MPHSVGLDVSQKTTAKGAYLGNASARAHDLDVAGLGATRIAQIVLMGDRALADVGDDLHLYTLTRVAAVFIVSQMRFDMICEANDIEHRLTKPNHPWTNGQAER